MQTLQPSKEIMKYLPHLSLAERDRRWQEIRKKMVMHGVDCLLLFGSDIFWDMGMVNFRYITHIGSKMGGYAIFPIEGEPVVFNAPPHCNTPFSPFLSAQDWVNDVRPYTGLQPVVAAIAEFGHERSRIGIVGYGSALAPHSVTYKDYMRIQELLPKATFTDFTPHIEEMRLIKSSEEIAMLAKAGEIARKVIDTMATAAQPGVKECELYADMVRTQIANGAEAQVFLLLTSGPIEGGDGVKHLLHGIEQPISPTTRTLQKGDIVICEFHTNYGGYLTATEFTVCLGKAPQQYRRIHDVSVECLYASLEMMRPGVTLRELWEAARAPVEKAGLDFIELGFHGHGMASPEFPTVVYRPAKGLLMSGDRIGNLELREGMVFGNNIDVFDPNWKIDVGHMLGDCVVIERNGPRRLVNIPDELPEIS